MTENSLIYFRDGKLLVESGDARVYKLDGGLFLEIGDGHNLWAFEDELKDYTYQLQDFPRGDCLEIGLGLGVVSRYLLTFPKVKHLTTVEINEHVINAHAKIPEDERKYQLGYDPSKHLILNADGLAYAYQTKKTFDFIFIDCYSVIDEDSLPMIADTVNACTRVLKRGGRMMGWLDPNTPEEHALIFEQIFSFV